MIIVQFNVEEIFLSHSVLVQVSLLLFGKEGGREECFGLDWNRFYSFQ